jgi:hypothetical protein
LRPSALSILAEYEMTRHSPAGAVVGPSDRRGVIGRTVANDDRLGTTQVVMGRRPLLDCLCASAARLPPGSCVPSTTQVQVKTRQDIAGSTPDTHVAHVSAIKATEEKRFESVNQFLRSLTDKAASFMSRSQVEVLLANVDEKIKTQV